MHNKVAAGLCFGAIASDSELAEKVTALPALTSDHALSTVHADAESGEPRWL